MLVNILISVCLLTSCSSKFVQESEISKCCPSKNNECIKSEDYEGVLLNEISVDGILHVRNLTELKVDRDAFRKVTINEVKNVEEQLQKELVEYVEPLIIEDLPAYIRQYIVLSKDKSELMIIPFFKPKFEGESNSLTDYACSELLIAYDYGRNFFTVVYDLSNQKIISVKK
ncbi:hypothetical protein [Acidiluteibacter ferrifornacis]|uniref:Uncharacterized protein n=1 Tax=Acidiluteibacter ferrifornacis TaxID=2692424 RepID=A0A6N9NLA8_9FLAO|nr:hypothetical protein [Acidiluteibacter ferrifornacis]NBG67488.1 hypothetical protein [Acidiluteibacter ferrifornacis]